MAPPLHLLPLGLLLHFLHAEGGLNPEGKVLMCGVSGTAVHLEGPGRFNQKYLEAKLCTHLVYYRFTIDHSTNRMVSANPETDFRFGGIGMLRWVTSLRKTYAGLRVLAFIGGWKEPSRMFSELAASPPRRKNFISSVLQLCGTEKLDGVMINWEHPTLHGGSPMDKQNYPILLKELKEEFKPLGLTLVIEVRSRRYIVEGGYQLDAIEPSVDLVVARLHSFHAYNHTSTRPAAPLTSNNEFSVKSGVEYLLSKGVTPRKLVLGMSTFGEVYKTTDPVPEGQYLGLPISQKVNSNWTKSPYIGYNEVRLLLSSGLWTKYWDESSSTPIAIGDRMIITYDDKKSLVEKTKLVTSKGLGGVFLEKLENDDFKGFFEGSSYPLVRAVREELLKEPPGLFADLINIKVVNHQW